MSIDDRWGAHRPTHTANKQIICSRGAAGWMYDCLSSAVQVIGFACIACAEIFYHNVSTCVSRENCHLSTTQTHIHTHRFSVCTPSVASRDLCHLLHFFLKQLFDVSAWWLCVVLFCAEQLSCSSRATSLSNGNCRLFVIYWVHDTPATITIRKNCMLQFLSGFNLCFLRWPFLLLLLLLQHHIDPITLLLL